jgi:type VI secretion system protein ImpC
MKPMPWRLLVLTEAGVHGDARTDGPIRCRAGADGASEWLATVRPNVDVPSPGGIAPAAAGGTLDCSDPRAFEPAAIAAHLSLTGAPDSKRIDAVLHDPGFQRLESAYRGIRLLLSHATEEIEVWVLSVARKELVERFRQAIFDPWNADAEAPPWALILADFDFTHRPEDLAMLRDLAAMAKVLQSPIVGATSPAFFDLRHMFHVTALPDLAGRLMDPVHAAWRTFQAGEEARWVALTINRYLQRTPYDLESMGFRESAEEAKPETYLWGRGIWLVGAAVARSISAHRHALDLSGRGGHFDDLPFRTFPVAANEMVPLSTEVPMPEEKAQEFSRAAFTPIVGRIRSNVAVLPIAVTLFRLQPGRLTVEGTLAYQLMAGRLAQYCNLLRSNLPEGDENTAAAFLKTELLGFLGALAGEEPETAVTVEPVRQEIEGKTRVLANVQVRPGVPLEGKKIEFEFNLPLQPR